MKKRIVFVNPCSDVSGAEVSLLLLMQGLNRELYEPILITPEEGDLNKNARCLGVEVISIPMHTMMVESNLYASIRDSIASAMEINSISHLLTELRADLVHVNSYRLGIPFSLAARKSGIPSVWHVRDIPNSIIKKKLLSWLVHIPSKVIAISNAVAESLSAEQHDNVAVIHNGVDIEKFTDLRDCTFRQEFGIAEDEYVLCAVGQLIPWKGQDLLIQSFRNIARSEVPVRLVIVGDVIKPIWHVSEHYLAFPKYLRELVKENNLEADVVFTGFRKDIPQILHEIDCLVHSPRSPEPFGRVIVEAMAAGKPVIAPCAGGIPEIVETGKSGLLFKSGDLASLTEVLQYAMLNPEHMDEMGQYGKLRAEQTFSAIKHVRSVTEIYEQLL